MHSPPRNGKVSILGVEALLHERVEQRIATKVNTRSALNCTLSSIEMAMRPERPFSFSLLTDVHCAAQDVHEYLVFSDEVEGFLEQSVEQLEAKIEERLKKIPKKHHQDFIESEALTVAQYQTLFPTLHRESVVVTLWSYLEHQISYICNQVSTEIASKIRLRDITGKGFERAFLFLKRVPQFDFSAISAEINFLRNTNKLRNVIVHSGGFLPEEKSEAVNRFVAAEESLGGKPGSLVQISPEFIRKCGENVKALFDEVGEAMQRYMDEHGRG